MYNSESLILLIRLRTLSPLVDYFVIGYSDTTFSGRHSRSLTYAPYDAQILAFSSKLFPLHFNMSRTDTNTWHREKASRHNLIEGVKLHHPAPNDVCIISDVDEIPKPSAIRFLIAHPAPVVLLAANFFYYSLRHRARQPWTKIGVVRYGSIDRPLGWFRGMPGVRVLPGIGGNHISYCFGYLSEIIRKLETFPHVEYSAGKYVDPNYIYARVACGQSLFEKRKRFETIDYHTHELDIPPEADHMSYRMPFKDLGDFPMNERKIRRWAVCPIRMDWVNGKLQMWK
jgi:beta-1,4-mannosyl-glycoprotein beta-1,4-N-acetylglucosaminyltransferase